MKLSEVIFIFLKFPHDFINKFRIMHDLTMIFSRSKGKRCFFKMSVPEKYYDRKIKKMPEKEEKHEK